MIPSGHRRSRTLAVSRLSRDHAAVLDLAGGAQEEQAARGPIGTGVQANEEVTSLRKRCIPRQAKHIPGCCQAQCIN
eukprot:1133671-Pelagomonas_calceolata.AAC.21